MPLDNKNERTQSPIIANERSRGNISAHNDSKRSKLQTKRTAY